MVPFNKVLNLTERKTLIFSLFLLTLPFIYLGINLVLECEYIDTISGFSLVRSSCFFLSYLTLFAVCILFDKIKVLFSYNKNVYFECVVNNCCIIAVLLSFVVLFLPPNLSVLLSIFLILMNFLIFSITFIFYKKSSPSAFKRSKCYNSLIKDDAKFAIFVSLPRNGMFHLEMWFPYLLQIGLNFVIITPKKDNFYDIVKFLKKIDKNSTPVMYTANARALRELIPQSIKAVFYANNGKDNNDCVRLVNITHIQLLHGDSNKLESYSPITQMYDKIFVSSDIAKNRYIQNGIIINNDKFEITGRPQVSQIKVIDKPTNQIKKILYAPTWYGKSKSQEYSSQLIGPKIIEELISQNISVIFRPHPLSYGNKKYKKAIQKVKQILHSDVKANKRGHMFGKNVEKEMSLYDCFNECDALVSDMSSVVNDFIYSQKPVFLIKNDAMDFDDDFRNALYIVDKNLGNFEELLKEHINKDSKFLDRRNLKSIYFEIETNSDSAKKFVEISKRVICSSEITNTEKILE